MPSRSVELEIGVIVRLWSIKAVRRRCPCQPLRTDADARGIENRLAHPIDLQILLAARDPGGSRAVQKRAIKRTRRCWGLGAADSGL
jgi:hypothetical protein